jgi:hypothetical protein
VRTKILGMVLALTTVLGVAVTLAGARGDDCASSPRNW